MTSCQDDFEEYDEFEEEVISERLPVEDHEDRPGSYTPRKYANKKVIRKLSTRKRLD